MSDIGIYTKANTNNFSREHLRELEKKDMEIIYEIINKEFGKNKERYSEKKFAEKFKKYIEENGETLESVKYYLTNCYPSYDKMYFYVNGAIADMAKGAFEDMINKKYDTILKTYANKIDLRNYIETVNMRRCDETFFKDEKTQIHYINKAGHNKFRFQDDYILNETQIQFIEDIKEYLKYVAGECNNVDSVVNYLFDLMACYVQGIKTESILFIVGYYG